ncbi:dihydrofolate synthase, partial [Mycobacterium tuberculosis]
PPLAPAFAFRFLVGVLRVLGAPAVAGLLAALAPVFASVVVPPPGSPRALAVAALALAAGARFGPARVRPAAPLRAALAVAPS